MDVFRFRTEEIGRVTHGVDPQIQDRAAGKLRIVDPVCIRPVLDLVEVDLHHADIADQPVFADETVQTPVQRLETCPERLHDKDLFFRCFLRDRPCLGGIDGKGLFAEHGFSVLQAEHCVFKMKAMRRGDVNDIDCGIRDQILIGSVCLFEAETLRECVCRLLSPRPDGIQDCAFFFQGIQRGGETLRDPAGPHDAPSDLLFHTTPPILSEV